jgi:hypothetical protein
MVGVDPALVLCYRDEYKLALGEQRGISMCCWPTNGYRKLWKHSSQSLLAVNRGTSLATVPK